MIFHELLMAYPFLMSKLLSSYCLRLRPHGFCRNVVFVFLLFSWIDLQSKYAFASEFPIYCIDLCFLFHEIEQTAIFSIRVSENILSRTHESFINVLPRFFLLSRMLVF